MNLHSPRFHKWFLFFWIGVGGPLTYFWLDKVEWISFMSWWALVEGRWSSYQAARVEKKT